MIELEVAQPSRAAAFLGELRKLPAFLRRDFLVAWSYRTNFVTDWVSLGVQALLFTFVGQLIDPSTMPTYGSTQASYVEFVAIGISLSVFVQIGLRSVSAGLRQEQLIGTLESLLITPTSTTTIQLGSVMYQLVYVPIRTAVFLLLMEVFAGADFDASGLLPAAILLVVVHSLHLGLGNRERRGRAGVPARGGRVRLRSRHTHARLGRLLPTQRHARLDRDHRQAQPDGDRHPRHARSLDWRFG